jgi:hypothetical protein
VLRTLKGLTVIILAAPGTAGAQTPPATGQTQTQAETKDQPARVRRAAAQRDQVRNVGEDRREVSEMSLDSAGTNDQGVRHD